MTDNRFGEGSRGKRQGGGEEGSSGKGAASAAVDAMMDLADDLEEQGRDLIRQAKQLQRVAQKLAGGSGAKATPRKSEGSRPSSRPAGRGFSRTGPGADRPREGGDRDGSARPTRPFVRSSEGAGDDESKPRASSPRSPSARPSRDGKSFDRERKPAGERSRSREDREERPARGGFGGSPPRGKPRPPSSPEWTPKKRGR